MPSLRLNGEQVEIVDPNIVRRVAKIIGLASGAVEALADYNARMAGGEHVAIYRGAGGMWIVGPDVRDLLAGDR